MGQAVKKDSQLTAKAVIQILHPDTAAGLKAKPPYKDNRKLLESTKAVLEKGVSGGVEGQNRETEGFEVQYNPATLRISETIAQELSNASDGLSADTNVAGNCTRTVSVDLVFYRQEGMAADFVRKRIEAFLAIMMKSPDRRISFTWAGLSCIGAVSSVNAAFDMFDEAGNPEYGTVKLSVREETDSMKKEFEKADAPKKEVIRSI